MSYNQVVLDFLDEIEDASNALKTSSSNQDKIDAANRVFDILKPLIKSGTDEMGIPVDECPYTDETREFHHRFVLMVAAVMAKTLNKMEQEHRLLTIDSMICTLFGKTLPESEDHSMRTLQENIRLLNEGFKNDAECFSMVSIQVFVLGFALGYKCGESHES